MSLKNLVDQNNASIRRMEAIAPLLSAFFDQELMAVHSQFPQANHGGLLMGCPIWGEDYIERMARYSLPSLGSDRNIRALSDCCWMVFYCRAVERPYIWELTRWLRQMGVHTIFRDLPDELLELVKKHPDHRYGPLSSIQNVLAHMAGHAGMGLHMYMPDIVYAEGYFERLLALAETHEAIVQQGISATEAAIPEIERYRHPTGYLALPDREMGGIALRHIHPRSGKLVMNGLDFPNQLPDSRQVIWVGRDSIQIADCCQLISYLSPELCLDAPIAFTSTLDMLAPEYIRGDFYMPTVDDGLTFFDLSDEGRIPPAGYADLDRWVFRAWSQVAFTDDYMPYLSRRSCTPVPPRAGGWMEEGQIEHQHLTLLSAMADGKQQAMETFFSGQHPPRWEREPVKQAAD